MALDIRKLRPAELVQLLNSTPLGNVIRRYTIYRQRDRAGYRIGDGRRIDFMRYVAWLARERHAPKPKADYNTIKESSAERSRALSAEARDIGELPAAQNPARKQEAERDFRFFCEAYFPAVFWRAWSPDHLRVIAKIEAAVLERQLFALAMPRGSGKSALCRTACLWAVLYGHSLFVSLIAATATIAAEQLAKVRMLLETNDALLEDFPEAVHPVRCLERITNRQVGQTYRGRPTYISITTHKLVLPTIEGSRSSGAIISTTGLDGAGIRGQSHQLVDGRLIRPSLVFLDDPQTRESANSPHQNAVREKLLAGDVLGMAGPGERIAGLLCTTVIAPGDMADNILSREKHPEWQGERTKMVYSFPTNEKLWARYAHIWAESLRGGHDGHEATDFYRDHREEMDAGAVVAWAERYDRDKELSALQHAMTLKIRDESAFFAEYQNEPLPEAEATALMKPDEIAARVSGYERRVVPVQAEHVTAFIDCHDKLLYYAVVAWAPDFTGWVVDYGTYPDQREPYFSLRSARRTLAMAARGAGREGAILAGLEKLAYAILGRAFRRSDGAELRVGLCLIDANYVRDVVYGFCRTTSQKDVMPSHGRYIGASKKPMADYIRKPGERLAPHWMISIARRGERVRHALVDVNHWKSFIHARLSAAKGDPGALTFFGRDPKAHRLLADHLTAEYPVQVSGPWGTVDEWKPRPENPDNHWFDCLVGCAAGASILGVQVPGTQSQEQRRERKRYTQADLVLKQWGSR